MFRLAKCIRARIKRYYKWGRQILISEYEKNLTNVISPILPYRATVLYLIEINAKIHITSDFSFSPNFEIGINKFEVGINKCLDTSHQVF